MGMRLAGVNGVVVHERDETLQKLHEVIADEEIGIVLITTKLMNLCKEEILAYKLSSKRPLLVEIPDRHASAHISQSIAGYIHDSLGIDVSQETGQVGRRD
jgi:V/A-type H+-transporting ATPase subunit F